MSNEDNYIDFAEIFGMSYSVSQLAAAMVEAAVVKKLWLAAIGHRPKMSKNSKKILRLIYGIYFKINIQFDYNYFE